MLKSTVLKTLAGAFILSVSVGICSSQTLAEVKVETGVTMKTRDGVTLRADIYRPDGEGTFPVLLQRTPYDKNNTINFARTAAAHGFMVVVQDVRGRYSSEGEWYTFKHEKEDGYDAVEWAAALPHSNGKVGMFGGSYVGATQMLTAIGHPPHLAGICPVVTASNYHENWTYQGGALEQWFDQSWTSGLAQDTVNREFKQATNAVVGSKTLPLTEYPLFNMGIEPTTFSAASVAPYLLDWMAHPQYDEYWKQWAIDENYPSIQVPALTIAAWYDIFQGGSLKNFIGLKAHAGNETARSGQHLLITIGGHAGIGQTIGTVDFGPEAKDYDENEITLHWYEYLFQGKQNEFATRKPVRIFVMGENKWREEDSWPLERAKATRYFLHSTGHANTSHGDGALATGENGPSSADIFIYDPAKPVPTVGGPLCCDGNHLPAGPRDQAEVETRDDVLVYSTPALEKDVEVTGPVSLDLFAATNVPDTDFTAKLVDVWPNGYVQNLTEGILRARYRESTQGAPKLLEAGKVYEYTIDLWSTSNVFLKGHKIRLEVSSSNFPRFDRNLNTGKDAATSATSVKATTTVYHDSQHPSTLILPIIPR